MAKNKPHKRSGAVAQAKADKQDTPVIFPDDPDAVSTISNLMKWRQSAT